MLEVNELDKSLLYQIMRLIFVICITITTFLIIKYLLILFYPFVIAIILSFLINPFVSYIEKKLKLSRLLATTFVILIVFILSTGALLLIITEIIQGTFYLSEKVPSHYHYFFQLLNHS